MEIGSRMLISGYFTLSISRLPLPMKHAKGTTAMHGSLVTPTDCPHHFCLQRIGDVVISLLFVDQAHTHTTVQKFNGLEVLAVPFHWWSRDWVIGSFVRNFIDADIHLLI